VVGRFVARRLGEGLCGDWVVLLCGIDVGRLGLVASWVFLEGLFLF
jgi:hypothetical protein